MSRVENRHKELSFKTHYAALPEHLVSLISNSSTLENNFCDNRRSKLPKRRVSSRLMSAHYPAYAGRNWDHRQGLLIHVHVKQNIDSLVSCQ